MQLGCGAQVTAFDLSTTGDAFAVGDMDGHAHVHPEKDSDFCVCCSRASVLNAHTCRFSLHSCVQINAYSQDIRLPEKPEPPEVVLSLDENDTE